MGRNIEELIKGYHRAYDSSVSSEQLEDDMNPKSQHKQSSSSHSLISKNNGNNGSSRNVMRQCDRSDNSSVGFNIFHRASIKKQASQNTIIRFREESSQDNDLDSDSMSVDIEEMLSRLKKNVQGKEQEKQDRLSFTHLKPNKVHRFSAKFKQLSHQKSFSNVNFKDSHSKINIPTCKSQTSAKKEGAFSRMDPLEYESKSVAKDDQSLSNQSMGKQSVKKEPRKRETSVKSTTTLKKKVSKSKGIKMIN